MALTLNESLDPLREVSIPSATPIIVTPKYSSSLYNVAESAMSRLTRDMSSTTMVSICFERTCPMSRSNPARCREAPLTAESENINLGLYWPPFSSMYFRHRYDWSSTLAQFCRLEENRA